MSPPGISMLGPQFRRGLVLCVFFSCSPQSFFEFFLQFCLGIWHLKVAFFLGGGGKFPVVSVSQETNHEKSSRIQGRFGTFFGTNSQRKFKRLRRLSFCRGCHAGVQPGQSGGSHRCTTCLLPRDRIRHKTLRACGALISQP